MPALLSHTHFQVAPAGSQVKTWQRVCLTNRAIDRKKKHMAVTHNIKNWAKSGKYERINIK